MLSWLAGDSPQSAQYERVGFHVETTSEAVDTSSQVMVMCYTSTDKKLALPCLFQWSRIRGNHVESLPAVKGNVYMCEPSDVGAVIEVWITSLDEDNQGTLSRRFGPVRIDAMLKRSVLKMLAESYCSFPVKFSYQQANVTNLECSLRMTDECIRVVHDATDTAYRFEYQAGDPTLQSAASDIVGVTVGVNKRNEACFDQFLHSLEISTSGSRRIFDKKFRLGFVNRISRDMFILAHKAFCARKILQPSFVLQKLNGLGTNHEGFNYLVEMASLNEQLYRLFQLNVRLEEDSKLYKQEIVRLQDDIEIIKNNFDKALRQNVALENNLNNISNIECAGDDKADSVLELCTAVPNELQLNLLKSPTKLIHNEQWSDEELDYSKSPNKEFMTIKKQRKDQLEQVTPSRFELANTRVDTLANEVNTLRDRLKKEEQTIRDLNKLLAYYTGLTCTLEQTQSENASLKVQNSLLQSQLTELQGQLRTMQQVNDIISTIKPEQNKLHSEHSEQQVKQLKQQLARYRRKYEQTFEELKLLKRGNEQLNRSRNLTLDSFVEQQCQILKEQCQLLTLENNRLKETCEKYRPVSQQVGKLKQEVNQLQHRLQHSSGSC